ncbi:MAG: VWA domain-containing protein [Proteobacteria bacterium]|nr:VWA domain-containing protein [Pseudomonadota bacterium]
MKFAKKFKIPVFAIIAAGTASCKPTQFVSAQKPSALSSTGIPLSCEQEKSKSIQLKSGEAIVLNLPKNCLSEGKSDKKPADIVFVVDITASMEDSLNTVKNGVGQFALRLRQEKGWDARFAAIGYRDRVVQMIPFTDESTLASSAKGWYADGGDDLQEAGQSALETAVKLIVQDAQANPARAKSDKVILYIADAISFALNGNHRDFSTAELESVFRAVPADLKSQLKFYHSTAKEVEACTLPTMFGCARKALSEDYAARKQMTALASNLGLRSKGFEFPFTESIMLSEFIDEFTPDRSCSLKSAFVKNAKGQEVAKTDDKGALKLPRTESGNPLSLEIERCCSSSPSTAPSNALGPSGSGAGAGAGAGASSASTDKLPTPAPKAASSDGATGGFCSSSKNTISLSF